MAIIPLRFGQNLMTSEIISNYTEVTMINVTWTNVSVSVVPLRSNIEKEKKLILIFSYLIFLVFFCDSEFLFFHCLGKTPSLFNKLCSWEGGWVSFLQEILALHGSNL